ncbi:Ca-activated chloride channel family protein [Haloferula luteola]|uniref:Ca-activated chloride channel family protein n=1 Tax=Haloferula luteola TaxID=595692 RepID=A0A840V294_9BACT|nr:VWA domain-containing protein [Haloferula luteola]MBB5349794.1 Ca-activated chloride channel family protein [Haloferula luteola]
MNEFLQHFRFAQPQWLWLALPCALLVILRRGRGADSAVKFSYLGVLISLGTKVRRTALSAGLPWFLVALIPALLGMARPVWRNSLQAKSASGIDIVVAFDVSLSMSIDDFVYQNQPLMRMDAAKGVVKDFIQGRPDDRIGLVLYSGQPYISGPITLDHDWLLQKLEDVRLDILEEQGTAIGSAIAASASKLDARDSKSKIIVLITDGASNSGKLSPLEAADHAKTLGIKIYTVAIGTEDGRVSRRIQNFPRQEFDLPTLKEIAAKTGGEFYWAQNLAELTDTFRTIDRLEKSKAQSHTIVEDTELFGGFVGLATLLTVLGLLSMALQPPPTP